MINIKLYSKVEKIKIKILMMQQFIKENELRDKIIASN